MKAAIKNCRACGAPLLKEPLLTFRGMPKGAQHMPSLSDLKSERGTDLVLRQCAGCGLAQLACAPVPYYREVIRAAAFSPEMGRFRARQFSAFVKRHGLRGKKVFEPGCGRGEYLRLMAAAGAKVYGLEYSAGAVKDCVKNGLKVSRGFVAPEEKMPGGPFQAFFTLNFLEHLPEPGAFLSGIAASLSENGVGLVEVPNFDMMLEKSLFSEFIPDHLFYFTARTLRSLLERSGFEVLSLKPVWKDYILSAEVRKRPELCLKDFAAAQARLKKTLQAYAGRFRRGRVAVWGAGHQALAVLALAGLAKKIRYVVDSAPFKQGKYTPATHIPIVPPERLSQDPVDAVIVMAASYSDEVAGILKRKFGGKIKIAVLRERGLEMLP